MTMLIPSQRQFIFLFLILLSNVTLAQSKTQRAIDALARDADLAHAGLGICVIDVESGQVIARNEDQRSMIPASNLKVLTTATAIGLLGADYRFKTELRYSGDIDANGVLNGNIWIVGYGDPTLGSDQMEEAEDLSAVMTKFRLAIQQKGIRKINGHIIGEDSYFTSSVNGPNWHWIDLGNYYGAGVWGLNIHENLYYLHFQQSSRLGSTPAVASVEPSIPELRFFNEVTSAGSRTGDNAYIYGAPFSYERYLRGTIPIGSGRFTIKGSMPDPPLFAAQELQASLQSVGILTTESALSGRQAKMRGTELSHSQLLMTHYSPTLAQIVERANVKSVNLYCETLLKTLGKEKGKEGSIDEGIDVVKDFWEDRGLSFDGVFLEDGSGLSARNVVTANFLANLLRKIALDKRLFDPLYNSLPVAGKSGGMKYLLRGTVADGKVRAKTGTLGRVRAFTGYATTRTGKLLAFSMMANDYECSSSEIRQKLAGIMRTLCE